MSTVQQIIAKAQSAETITPEEAEQVRTYMEDDLGPAINKAAQAISDALRPAMQKVADAFNSPEGRALIELARQYEEQKR